MVTAKHVIIEAEENNPDGNLWIRINTKHGLEQVATPINAWQFSSDISVDAAVFAWAPDQSVVDSNFNSRYKRIDCARRNRFRG